MSYIINYTSVFRIKNQAKSRFTGSSRYRVINDELITVIKDSRKKEPEKAEFIETEKTTQVRGVFENDQSINTVLNTEIENIQISENKQGKKEVHLYRINKTKVKRKCYALSRLEKSKLFLAFYSISFPQGLSDQTAYKLFNTWLTRCRKNTGLTSYLWVAERQKNGTIHFHLLTNDRMPIRVVNGFMATALTTEKNKGNEALKDVNTSIYNGVDVLKVRKNKKGLINYIAKYVSKNEITFYRLPWHCSRDVSRLFTSTTFEQEEFDHYLDMLPQSLDNYTDKIEQEGLYTGYGFKFNAPDSVFENIDSVNEVVYNT